MRRERISMTSYWVILLISFRISCDVIFGVWKVWLIWWHQWIFCPQTDGIPSISPENCASQNRLSVFAERAFATWTWSGNRLRAKGCMRHGLLQSLWGRFLYSLYIVFGRDPASFIPTISIIVLPSTVALSKKGKYVWTCMRSSGYPTAPWFVALGGGFNALCFQQVITPAKGLVSRPCMESFVVVTSSTCYYHEN